MKGPVVLAALLVAPLALSACGRVGPIRPPGPRSEVVYPRIYPYVPPRTAPGTPAGPAALDSAASPTVGLGAAGTSESEQSQGGTTVTRPGSPR